MLKTKMKTVEDAFAYLGLDATALPNVDLLPVNSQKAVVDYYKLTVVCAALNEEANNGNKWLPDWNNYNQYKYYPWFDMRAGSGFAFGGCDYDRTDPGVGGRLCYINRDVAAYAGKQFIELYKSIFLQ